MENNKIIFKHLKMQKNENLFYLVYAFAFIPFAKLEQYRRHEILIYRVTVTVDDARLIKPKPSCGRNDKIQSLFARMKHMVKNFE